MFSKTSQFEKLLEKATSSLLLEPDWAANVSLCDMIRQNDVPAKSAFPSIKKRLTNDNPHTVMFTLQLLETLTKNCGSPVHDAIGTSDFMEVMQSIALNSTDPVKAKSLEMIQSWSKTFGKKNRNVIDVYEDLLSHNVVFPPFRESEAMFSSESAPEWKVGDVCHRCKSTFSTFKRRHHCRNCGNIVCDECSSKRSTIPRFGIEKEVRVCDPCFASLSGKAKSSSSGGEKSTTGTTATPSSSSSRSSKKNRTDSSKAVSFSSDSKSTDASTTGAKQVDEETRKRREKELELREKEELELAIALSASEAESKEKQRMRQLGYNALAPTPSTQNQQLFHQQQQPQQQQQQQQQLPIDNNSTRAVYSQLDTSEIDPELARYLNRNYWEGRNGQQSNNPQQQMLQPGAPPMSSSSSVVGAAINTQAIQGNLSTSSAIVNAAMQQTGNGDLQDMSSTGEDEAATQAALKQKDEFLSALRSSIDIFVNRMRSNSLRNRNISMDSTVQTLFLTLNAMHPQLLFYINGLEDQRMYYESLQDKLSQLRDAREALNALRNDNAERRRQEEMEAARQRQMAMHHKLQVMRAQKEEYLHMQRQMALQRLQEQEREMSMRLEHQKHMHTNPGMWPTMMHPQGGPTSAPGVYYPAPPPQPGQQQQLPPQQVQQIPQTQSGNIYGPSPSMAMPNMLPTLHSGMPDGGYYNMQGLQQALPNPNYYVGAPPPVGVYNIPPSLPQQQGGGMNSDRQASEQLQALQQQQHQQQQQQRPLVEEASLISFD